MFLIFIYSIGSLTPVLGEQENREKNAETKGNIRKPIKHICDSEQEGTSAKTIYFNFLLNDAKFSNLNRQVFYVFLFAFKTKG